MTQQQIETVLFRIRADIGRLFDHPPTKHQSKRSRALTFEKVTVPTTTFSHREIKAETDTGRNPMLFKSRVRRPEFISLREAPPVEIPRFQAYFRITVFCEPIEVVARLWSRLFLAPYLYPTR